VKALELLTRWTIRRRNERLRRRKIRKRERFQPLQEMLEAINQPLGTMLRVLVVSSSLERKIASPNSLAVFVRVIIFSRISMVFPRS
jgi:hypothetical protein